MEKMDERKPRPGSPQSFPSSSPVPFREPCSQPVFPASQPPKTSTSAGDSSGALVKFGLKGIMKHLLLTTIAAVLLMGYGPSQQSAPPSEVKPEPTTAKAPDISIHNAAFSGNIEAVKQHIAAGTDVNAMNKYGWTPLHEAVTGGHKDIADLLIAEGADVNAKEAKNRITPLHWAAWRGRKEIAELLIAKGADLNTKNKDGGTPLHNVAWKGHVEIAKLLIVKKTDMNAKDVEGQTPLDWAKNKPEIAALLRKHGGKTGEELKAEGK